MDSRQLKMKRDKYSTKNSNQYFMKISDTLKLYNDSINGNYVDLKDDFSNIICYKQCPITSVEVERMFSELKHILSDRRHNFKQKNFEMYTIINFSQIL